MKVFQVEQKTEQSQAGCRIKGLVGHETGHKQGGRQTARSGTGQIEGIGQIRFFGPGQQDADVRGAEEEGHDQDEAYKAQIQPEVFSQARDSGSNPTRRTSG